MVWQLFASVMVPGFIINRTVKASTWLISKLAQNKLLHNKAVIRWAPVVIGICTIPFIVEPIDHSVTKVMDKTARTFYTLNQ